MASEWMFLFYMNVLAYNLEAIFISTHVKSLYFILSKLFPIEEKIWIEMYVNTP